MSLSRLALLLAALTLPALTGCLVLDPASNADVPVIVDNLKIEVRSGQQPVAGASIQLYEADLTSYTGTSAARLPNPLITGSDGSYTASTVLVCNPHSLFYLVATGGNAGSGDDPAIALVTAVGHCEALATSTIVLNEATTVASAYALSGFMSSLTSVSANATVGTNGGTVLARTGITNAFDLVHNLVDIHTGVTLATTPAGNGTVPQAKLNSLANLLAACIESPNFSSTPCTGLNTNAPSAAGTPPADTTQAILNIAHNPGANIAAIAALLPAAPYTPALTGPPNDLTLSIIYAGTVATDYQALAADNGGHIWVASSSTSSTVDPGSAIEFNPRGKVEATYTGAATGIASPDAIVIDPQDNVWLENCGTISSLTRIAVGGSPLLNIPQNTGYPCTTALASDGLGNIYSAYGNGIDHNHFVEKYSNAGVPATGSFPLNIVPEYYAPVSLSIDGTGHIALADIRGGVAFFTAAGAITGSFFEMEIYPTTFSGGAYDHAGDFFWTGEQSYVREGTYDGLLLKLDPTIVPTPFSGPWASGVGGIARPRAVVIDGAGTQWVSNIAGGSSQFGTSFPANVSAITSTRQVLSPGTGFQSGPAVCGSLGIAIDIAGNVWTADECTSTVAEYIGLAVPVTPLAIGVRDNTVGQRP